MATNLEELKKQVDDAIKRQKGADIDLITQETMLKNKKMVLGNLESAIKELEKQRDSLKADNKAKNMELDEATNQRRDHAEAMLKKALEETEKVRIEKNALSIERNVIQDQKNQAVEMAKDFADKTARLKLLIAEINKVF